MTEKPWVRSKLVPTTQKRGLNSTLANPLATVCLADAMERTKNSISSILVI